ncbi:MAG: MarR family winged helix-turn-helix transcriptional regulator [Pseudomonadales bacterium]
MPKKQTDEPNAIEELEVLERMTQLLVPSEISRAEKESTEIIWHLIRLAKHAEHRLEYSVHRPLGWTWAGFRIMVNVFAMERAEPSKLSALLGVSRPTLTSALNKLEANGHITRKTDAQNRRRVFVTLTAKGRAAVKNAIPLQREIEKSLIDPLSASQRKSLLQSLNELMAGLQR